MPKTPLHLSEVVTVQLTIDGLNHSGTGRGHIEIDLPPEVSLRPLAVGSAMKTATLAAIQQAFEAIEDQLADYWTKKLSADQGISDSERNV